MKIGENSMIGIITLYYKNYNIGGLLQAYALQKTIQKLGYESQQMCVWHYEPQNISKREKICIKTKRILRHPIEEIKQTFRNNDIRKRINKIQDDITERKLLMDEFMKRIPHSEKVYTCSNVKESLNIYDGYIVGSDQVWNDDYITENYMDINLLFFVPDDYWKISYAASIGKSSGYKEWFQKKISILKNFNNISVREESARNYLEQREKLDAKVVLDPTLLLEKSDWNELVGKKEKNKDPYIFTYFLGKNRQNRKLAEEIAKKQNLKIINFAHAINFFRDEDQNYGDISLKVYSPENFIEYIAGSELVITDSFHAIVFSIIYEKEFYAVPRESDGNIGSMNSRIFDLLKKYKLECRFIDNKEISEITVENKINYLDVKKILENEKEYSIDYLKKELSDYEKGKLHESK